MVFLGLRYPTPASRRVATDYGAKRGLNYPVEHIGATRHVPPAPPVLSRKDTGTGKDDVPPKAPFRVSFPYATDSSFVRVGAGSEDFAVAKRAVSEWKHFQLGWSEVAKGTGVNPGDAVCVCANVLGVWIRNPLRVVYNEETTNAISCSSSLEEKNAANPKTKTVRRRFALAHGCLEGHLLSGEEAFVVERRADESVWFGVNTFSRPAHLLSVVSYPVVRALQWRFARDAARSVRREVESARDARGSKKTK
jgi:uncharacterized protein (UPF0548 family)